jgi:hypothetical protein
MADEPKPTPATPAATAAQIAGAIKEYDEASDRVAVLKKFPFLADALNARANQPPTKK